MKLTMIATVLMFANLAHASQFLGSKLSPALAEEIKQDRALDLRIENALKRSVNVHVLKGFSVDWSSLTCLAVDTSELSKQGGGVCTVTAGAMSVSAQIAIVKSMAKHASVSVIYADVE